MSSPGRLDRAAVGRGITAPEHSADEPAPPAMARNRRTILIAAVAAALVVTAILFYQWGSGGSATPTPTAAKPTPSATRPPTTAQIYAAVAPSVVSIDAAGASRAHTTGTGIIVNADGTILTALHVVKDATAIRLTFADGTESAATVIGSDPTIDIAAIGPASLPSIVVPAVLGNAGALAVGDNVIAIGNQLGLTRTTTTGVVSGLNRSAPSPDGTAALAGLIQFDAAVNPGSSGGPLLNSKGETVGIVVALANPTPAGTFIGVGFAVPIGAALGGRGGDRVPQQ
jgi:putative serine protease PepD